MKKMKLGVFAMLSVSAMATYAGTPTPCVDSSTQFCGMQVLIEQYAVDFTNATQTQEMTNFLTVFPNVQQLHMRIDAPGADHPGDYVALSNGNFTSADVSAVVAQVQAFRKLYGNNIALGFHPDDSTDKVQNAAKTAQLDGFGKWGCPDPTLDSAGNTKEVTGWKCVLTNNLQYMQAINKELGSVPGFSILSIEQSYTLPQDGPGPDSLDEVAQEKSMINTLTGNTVKYGYVAPSCGNGNLYDAAHFDYGYPQMYNLVSPYPGYLPARPVDFPGAAVIDGTLVDAIPPTGKNEPASAEPTTLNPQGTDIKSIYESNVFDQTGQPNPKDAGEVLAAVLTNLLGTTINGNTCTPNDVSSGGSIRYITLSGEPEFLGAPGWNAQNLVLFFSTLTTELGNDGVQNADQIPYAIWGFDTMLPNFNTPAFSKTIDKGVTHS